MIVGIETDRGPWMSALVAAGYRVYAINPRSIDRYRERHHVGGGKSDAGDAKLLADLVRTDRHNHRGFAGATIGGRIASEVLLPKSRHLRHNLLPRGMTVGGLLERRSGSARPSNVRRRIWVTSDSDLRSQLGSGSMLRRIPPHRD